VLKFKWERVATEDEAQVYVDKLVDLCEQESWELSPIANVEGCGLAEAAAAAARKAAAAVEPALEAMQAATKAAATMTAAAKEVRGWWGAARARARAREAEQAAERKAAAYKRAVATKATMERRAAEAKEMAVLFHGRYIRGVYSFDKGASAEGYVRFRTEDDANAARRHPDLKRMCGGKEPELMGEDVFENELKFRRGLSVMGSLYASATGTCVLQLTDPPGKLGQEVAPDELVSERTGTVFVVRTDMSLEELRQELGDCMLACEKKGWGEVVVRVDGETAARAARSLNEGGYPLRRKDRVVYPMYNMRPYSSRGWPTFETSAASIMLAHLTQVQQRFQRGEELSDKLKQLLASLEGSGPKLINIDLVGTSPCVVEQSPERLLRQCKKKLLSKDPKKIFFTGKADQNDVVQLLSDFEDSIAVEFDQKRARRLKLLTEDLEHAHTAKLGEARRARSRKLP
jgi:hypothetical protein